MGCLALFCSTRSLVHDFLRKWTHCGLRLLSKSFIFPRCSQVERFTGESPASPHFLFEFCVLLASSETYLILPCRIRRRYVLGCMIAFDRASTPLVSRARLGTEEPPHAPNTQTVGRGLHPWAARLLRPAARRGNASLSNWGSDAPDPRHTARLVWTR